MEEAAAMIEVICRFDDDGKREPVEIEFHEGRNTVILTRDTHRVLGRGKNLYEALKDAGFCHEGE